MRAGEPFSPAAAAAWGLVPVVDEVPADPECEKCGGRATDRHHITPRAAGGGDEPQNLMWLCKGCHIDRHTLRLVPLYGALRVNPHGWLDVLVPDALLYDRRVDSGAVVMWCNMVLDPRGYATLASARERAEVDASTVKRRAEKLVAAGWAEKREGVGLWAPGPRS